MPDNLENMDFSSNPLNVGLVFDLVLLQNFNGYFLTSDQMSTQPYFSECSLPKWTAYNS